LSKIKYKIKDKDKNKGNRDFYNKRLPVCLNEKIKRIELELFIEQKKTELN
jgi:hypothetical protein